MRSILLTFSLISILSTNVFAQCGGTILTVQNPSFEGTQQPHVTPPSWNICMPGKTPDTQPGSWGITLPPTNGSSYLGLVSQISAGWVEGAGQTLSAPMIAGTEYKFSIDLATTNTTQGGIVPGCVELQIWGGMGACDTTELLWHSGNVTNLTWQTHQISFKPSASYTHILLLIHTLGCSAQPYIMVDNMTPLIPMGDQPNFVYSDSSGGYNHMCIGDPILFTDRSVSPRGVVTTWDWDFGDLTPHSSAQNVLHAYSAAGTYQVTLTIISSVGCTTSIKHFVTINPFPVITVTPPNPNVCSGDSVLLVASGASTYTWTPAIGLSATTGDSIKSSPLRSISYLVTGIDLNGCVDTTICKVTPVANPVPSVSTTGTNCGDSTGTATASPSGLTYVWSNSDTTETIVDVPTGTYTVTVTDSLGCRGVDSGMVDVITNYTVSITTTNELCGKQNGTMTAIPTGNPGPYTYRWSSGETTQTIVNHSAGPYTVTVDVAGCPVAASASIISTKGAQAVFMVYPDVLTKDNNTCQIADLSTGNPSQWQWDLGDGYTTTGHVYSHSYEDLGTYTITLIVSDTAGCSDTASHTVIVKDIFAFYIPNAFTPDGDGDNDVFMPAGINFQLDEFQMYIYNRWGEQLYSTTDISKPWNGTLNNNGNLMPIGVYVYHILLREESGKRHEYIGRITLLLP